MKQLSKAYIIQDYGDICHPSIVAASLVSSTAEAIKFYKEHGVNFGDVYYNDERHEFEYWIDQLATQGD